MHNSVFVLSLVEIKECWDVKKKRVLLVKIGFVLLPVCIRFLSFCHCQSDSDTPLITGANFRPGSGSVCFEWWE